MRKVEEIMSEIDTHVAPVAYRKDRTADEQYKTLLRRIKETGKPAQSGMDEGSTEVLGAILEYDLENGFPLITERDLMKVSSPEAIASYASDESHRALSVMVKQSVGESLLLWNCPACSRAKKRKILLERPLFLNSEW
jgi:hypothetical protein